jgi:hypothetical protein
MACTMELKEVQALFTACMTGGKNLNNLRFHS